MFSKPSNTRLLGPALVLAFVGLLSQPVASQDQGSQTVDIQDVVRGGTYIPFSVKDRIKLALKFYVDPEGARNSALVYMFDPNEFRPDSLAQLFEMAKKNEIGVATQQTDGIFSVTPGSKFLENIRRENERGAEVCLDACLMQGWKQHLGAGSAGLVGPHDRLLGSKSEGEIFTWRPDTLGGLALDRVL